MNGKYAIRPDPQWPKFSKWNIAKPVKRKQQSTLPALSANLTGFHFGRLFKSFPGTSRLLPKTAISSRRLQIVPKVALPFVRRASSILNSEHFKRLFDIMVASVALLLLAPLLGLVCLIIRYRNGFWKPEPIFFKHTRIGRHGRRFACIKFRTMKVGSDEILKQYLATNADAAAEWLERQKLKSDPRVEPFGAILRKTSIDELPQLINVLRGEMSCVGPRPITDEEVVRYGKRLTDYMRVRPGISGLWQIKGRNSIGYERRVALDTYYSRSRSFWLDLRILFLTLPAVFRMAETS